LYNEGGNNIKSKNMFFAVFLIILGLFLLLDGLGIIVGGSFWGLFWAVVFISLGIRLLMKRGKCPICGWGVWQGKFHEKIHDKMHEHCCGKEGREDSQG